MSDARRTTCPHCGDELTPLGIPEALFAWAHDLACFNDQCPYYQRGWAWMERQYGVRASYRYRIDGQSGQASPMAVRASSAPGGEAATGALPQEQP